MNPIFWLKNPKQHIYRNLCLNKKGNEFYNVFKGDQWEICVNMQVTQQGGEVEDLPLFLSTNANNDSNLRCHEAMNGPDAEDCREAMHIKYKQLQKKKAGLLLK